MSTAIAAGGHAAGRWATAAAGLAGLGRSRAEPGQQPPLAQGEWACLCERAPGGGLNVASRRALYTRRAAAPVSAWSRLGREQVAALSWPRPGAALHVSLWPHTDTAAGLDLDVERNSWLPAFARERVAACRLLERRVRLGGGRDATLGRPPRPRHRSGQLAGPLRHPERAGGGGRRRRHRDVEQSAGGIRFLRWWLAPRGAGLGDLVCYAALPGRAVG